MKTKSIYILLLVLLCSTGVSGQQNYDRLEILKNDSLVLTASTHIKELVVYADKNSSGQLLVQSGIVQIDRLVLHFTFVPSEWTMISFPGAVADLRSPSASNLAALGFNFSSGSKRFQLRKYDPSARALDKDPWITAIDPSVPANSGVMMSVTTGTTTPQAIEFYFDNTSLRSAPQNGEVLIDLDLKGKAMQQDYAVTIQPVNAAGKPLELIVRNAPESAPAPLNYADELANATIYYTIDKQSIRIALPTGETARVLIMDRKMKKVIDAYQYSAPAAISVGHLKKGKYQLYIEYGPASIVKTLKIN